MIRILHVIHGLNLGGAENFIYNLLGAIDHNGYCFDFVIQECDIKHKKFEALIYRSGGQIYRIPDFVRNPICHAIEFKKIIKRGYDVIHIHMNAFINPFPAIIAGRCGAKVLIHSHSTQNGKGGKIGKIVHNLNKSIFLKDGFVRLACGEEAGRWMFDKRSYIVVPNGVDAEIYGFRNQFRKQIRSKYGIDDDCFLIGQVGRLIPLKNQSFSLEILHKLKIDHPELNAKMIFLGEGPDAEMLREKVKKLGLQEQAIFAGAVQNANEFYSAFDTFIMPSWFEGLGYVAVEAQASGLKCVISDSVPREVDATGFVSFAPLDSPQVWIDRLLDNAESYDRNEIITAFRKSKFDVTNTVTKMVGLYEGHIDYSLNI